MPGRPLALPITAIALALAALALALTAPGPASAAEHSFDYLSIQANQGDSSGGHAAIRFGDWTYHFQHDRGLLRLRREDWGRFEYRYRTLENRGIELSRVATSQATYTQLRRTFQRRYLVEERQQRLLRGLRADVALLEQLLRQDAGEPASLSLRGAGFFAGPADGPPPERLAALRERLLERHGADFFAERRRGLDSALSGLDPAPPDLAGIPLDPAHYPDVPAGFARRYVECVTLRLALAVLEQPRPLRDAVLVSALEPLDAAERGRLQHTADALQDSLLRLAASGRPDRGYPLLLGLARLAALERSLATGRLELLEALPADAEGLAVDARRRRVLARVLEEAKGDLRVARARALGPVPPGRSAGFREADWGRLEAAASRAREVERAAAGAPELRVRPGPLLPEGRAALSPLPRPAAATADLRRALEASRRVERETARGLRAHRGYDLVSRNCVSEIFRTIDSALAADGGDVRERSRRQLGGYVHPVARLNFVPFVSSRNVRARYDVSSRASLPSYRRQRLAELEPQQGRLALALRESNVWTSTLYEPSAEDGFFVFFTDGSPVLRPLLGAGNLVAGLVRSGVGVVALPLDGGRGLRAGLSGMVFSLPELFFVNLRKGSNDYVAPELRPNLPTSLSYSGQLLDNDPTSP